MKRMTLRLLASNCSQTVKSATDICYMSKCMSVIVVYVGFGRVHQ